MYMCIKVALFWPGLVVDGQARPDCPHLRGRPSFVRLDLAHVFEPENNLVLTWPGLARSSTQKTCAFVYVYSYI